MPSPLRFSGALSVVLLAACSGEITTHATTPRTLGALAVERRGCGTCHSSAAGILAGGSGPNLTPDSETGVGEWTDEQLANAIRYGVDDEDATLGSAMPRAPDMSDAEVRDIVAYLRSLPPVHNEVSVAESEPTEEDQALHGELVVTQQNCRSCHGMNLAGSDSPVAGSMSYGPNLTPDQDTGIGSWTREQVIRAVKTGTDDEDAQLCSQMPRYATLSDDALEGLALYLARLVPVSHETPETTCTDVVSPVDTGRALVEQLGCASCHGADLGGNAAGLDHRPIYPSNLTPDHDTGLGSWTDAQIAGAIRLGTDDEGATLCDAMPRYPMLSDDEATAIVAYLRSVAPVHAEMPESVCGQAGTGGPDAGAGEADAGVVTPMPDAGAGGADAGHPDAGHPDAGAADAGPADAGVPDAGPPDAGAADAGTPDAGGGTCFGSAVVISEVYGGGGNVGATYNADFVELHNRSHAAVDVSGWAIQYASSAGSSWSTTSGVLAGGTTIAAGGYLLIAVGGHGTNGAVLPGTAVNLSHAIDLSASAGKVALTRTSVPLSGACPTSNDLVDFVGYGVANCSEGSQPAPALSSSLAAFRGAAGSELACADTDVNGSDFTAATPAPHAAANACSCF